MRGLATISGPSRVESSRLLTADDDNNAAERRRTASETECSVPARCRIISAAASCRSPDGKLPAIIVRLAGPVVRGNAVIRRLAVAEADRGV